MNNISNQDSVGVLKKIAQQLAKTDNLTYLGLFGSSARGEAKETSDLDIIVAFKKTPSLFKLMDFEDKLQKLTGRKIDLLTHDSINPLIKPNIDKDLIILYERY